MLVLTLIPAAVWKAPTNDASYSGFDPNLVYASRGGDGTVQVSAGAVDITAPPGSTPSANLATTLLQKLNASVGVDVLENIGANEPLRVGVWSPWTGSGYFVVFGPAPSNSIVAETIRGGGAGPTLMLGAVLGSTPLGNYQLGSTYHVGFSVDKAAGRMTEAVSGDGANGLASLDRQQAPALFENVQLSLTASAQAGSGRSRVVLSNYVLTLPHQRSWASRVDDPVPEVMLIVLAVLGALAIVVAVGASGSNGTVPRLVLGIRRSLGGLPALVRDRGRTIPVTGAIGVFLLGNALLFSLGSHPFDMSVQKLYTYVAREYGLAQLYLLPNLVSQPAIWGGIPYIESAFPYEPVSAYLSGALGWLGSLLFGAGAPLPTSQVRLEYLIKAANVLFGLADAGLIYAVLRQLAVDKRWSLIGSAMWLFNPAVWFSMSVWGQTHVMSLFFVLAAIWLAEKHLPLWAWLSLAAACLTRPQMLVFGLLIGIVLLRKFSWSANLTALSWTVVIAFLALLPFTIPTSPSLPIDIMLNNFRVQEAGGNSAALTTVSQGAYSVWPLVTYVARGASGLGRASTLSSETLVGTLTYQRLSLLLTVAAMVAFGAVLALRKRAAFELGGYLPIVALGIVTFLMLLTGIVATHFLLALPFLILCRRWMGSTAYFYVLGVWTITTFVPMFGGMGIGLSSQLYPLLAPDRNAITKFFIDLYTWDRFITTCVVANICAVIWLAVLAFKHGSTPGAAPVAA
jgi:hypothetical protein